MENPAKNAVKALHDSRWSIEIYYCELKKISLYKQDWEVIQSAITNKINSILSIF